MIVFYIFVLETILMLCMVIWAIIDSFLLYICCKDVVDPYAMHGDLGREIFADFENID